MRALALCVVLALAGCPKPSPAPPTPPPVPDGMAQCAGQPEPVNTGLCGTFTPEGLACVACAGYDGCLDGRDQAYCVSATQGCHDARCSLAAGRR